MEPIFTDTSMDWSKPAAYEAYKSLRRARNSWPNNTEGPTEAREWQDPEMLGLDVRYFLFFLTFCTEKPQSS
jgi:hypothetical protein